MYKWYHNATVCFVYLSDFPSDLGIEDLGQAQWFQRGWTLQELLAPGMVEFYSSDWKMIGDLASLAPMLSTITRIDESILLNATPLESTSIAKRMSWAASRKTSRPEDIAYCLMGLFSVNMPLLYGEGGQKAFQRLQEEIMKHSDDHSLFAWRDPQVGEDDERGLLAKSPSQFKDSSGFIPYTDWQGREPYILTNMGIQIRLQLEEQHGSHFKAALACPVPPDHETSTFLAVHLKKLETGTNQYVRVQASELSKVKATEKAKRIYVRQSASHQPRDKIYPSNMLQLRSLSKSGDYTVHRIISASRGYEPPSFLFSILCQDWVPKNYAQMLYHLPRAARQIALGIVLHSGNRFLVILLGSMGGSRPGFNAAPFDVKRGDEEVPKMEFYPLESEDTKHLYDEEVSVSFVPKINGAIKYYMVDITIRTKSIDKSPLTPDLGKKETKQPTNRFFWKR